MALNRVAIPSPNYYYGNNGQRLLVIHTAEGSRSYQSLGAYFQGGVPVSSHVGIDDTPNTVGEYVRRQDSSWTCQDFNQVSLNAELCGFAAWSPAEWQTHAGMLANCAAWIAEESAATGIPITRLSPAEAQGSGRGVCAHSDLGDRGGGHTDPGPNFPWHDVLEMARGQSSPPPQQPERTEDLVPLTSVLDRDGHLVVYGVDENGHLWEVTTKPPDPNTPMTKTYRWSDLTQNGQNGQQLAKT